MKANKLSALIVTTYIGFISTAHASTPQPVFSPEQEARIGEIAANYLVSHPEILVTVSNLAEALGLTGTPGSIVMPVSGATPDTITVFPEAVTAERLWAAIRKATQAQ